MNERKKLTTLFREVINLIIKFFKPYGLQDKLLEIPESIKNMGFKVGCMNWIMTVISLAFAFLLKLTNMAIEARLILLGIILFMLYRGQRVISDAFGVFKSSERQKYDLVFKNEIVLRGSQIIGKTADKILKFDKTNNLYTIMNNEAVLNTIQQYLENVWHNKIQHNFDILEMISVFAMLITAIFTNTAIPQYIFVPLVIFFVFFSFFSSAYISLNRNEFYRKHREYHNEQSLIINDLLRVPVIVNADLDMRINKFQKTVVESNANVTQFHNKLNLSRLFITATEALSQYGIIIFYLLGVEWNSISLATITEVGATLVIVSTALGYINRIANTLNTHNDRLIIIEKEEYDMSLILDVYHRESKKTSVSKVINDITINPFSIKYLEESENDKPFTLTSPNTLNIHKGEVVILSGVSGSGKSTFMKLLTERIRVEKNAKIPSTSRFLFYDEKLKFGSLSIFEELFCCTENPNLEKMQKILENLHLWTEIKCNCFDVWKYMKEKRFGYTLSNGQKQRLILAKMLYWLDEHIDVMVLDECTSGLDDKSDVDAADAERILEYIVRYCNQDKKRIVIISTHQNIDGFKHKLEGEYHFKTLQFKKDGEKNIVKEI